MITKPVITHLASFSQSPGLNCKRVPFTSQAAGIAYQGVPQFSTRSGLVEKTTLTSLQWHHREAFHVSKDLGG